MKASKENNNTNGKGGQHAPTAFSLVLRLACVTSGVLLFQYFSFLFNEVYVKETELMRYNINSLAFLVAGALLGLLVAPHLQAGIQVAHQQIVSLVRRFPAQFLASGSVGVVAGMVFSMLAGLPIYLFLPDYRTIGFIFTLSCAVLFGYIGALVFSRLPLWGADRTARAHAAAVAAAQPGEALPKVIDSSVIIDGRILQLCRAGFVEGRLLIPTAVLEEVRKVADDADSIRRHRGRAGLDVIEKLKEDGKVQVEIVEIEKRHDGIEEAVDSLLLNYAMEIGGVLDTNDYNLSKVAELRDVRVLNLNVLANTLRKTLLPGEQIDVNVVKYGKEVGQGIAYLDDGTMIVVESGDKFIGENVTIELSSIMQTVAGRLIFAKIVREPDNGAH